MELAHWQKLGWARTPEGAEGELRAALLFRGSLVRWCRARGIRLQLRLRMQDAHPARMEEAKALEIPQGSMVLARHASLLWGGRVAVEAWSWIAAEALPLLLVDELAAGKAPLGELWRAYGLGFVRSSPAYARVSLPPWGCCWARRSLLVAETVPARALIIEVFTPQFVRALNTKQAIPHAL